MSIDTIHAIYFAVIIINLIAIWIVFNRQTKQKHEYVLTFIYGKDTQVLMVVIIKPDQSLVSAINQCYSNFAAADKFDARLTDIRKL